MPEPPVPALMPRTAADQLPALVRVTRPSTPTADPDVELVRPSKPGNVPLADVRVKNPPRPVELYPYTPVPEVLFPYTPRPPGVWPNTPQPLPTCSPQTPMPRTPRPLLRPRKPADIPAGLVEEMTPYTPVA